PSCPIPAALRRRVVHRADARPRGADHRRARPKLAVSFVTSELEDLLGSPRKQRVANRASVAAKHRDFTSLVVDDDLEPMALDRLTKQRELEIVAFPRRIRVQNHDS